MYHQVRVKTNVGYGLCLGPNISNRVSHVYSRSHGGTERRNDHRRNESLLPKVKCAELADHNSELGLGLARVILYKKHQLLLISNSLSCVIWYPEIDLSYRSTLLIT